MRLTTTAAFLLCGSLSLVGPALAQSVGAPAGRDPATAPGGTEGIAGPRNEMNAVRDGDAVPVPPGRGGIEVDPPAGPAMEPAPPPPPRP
ncbi:hypothetical protein [Methylobacterium planeticum]|uniref:Uncharacterized protein n=1 Tax=Methylobacterium planeticum TaxID=2615211 RepID=A0A6N6MQQ3_9HYPH|nr:hypothetical protein [Methylobacterium planeticum]KAB1072420.1 hypothetical protein F6X51_15610 [Methylobacterium planeticum]